MEEFSKKKREEISGGKDEVDETQFEAMAAYPSKTGKLANLRRKILSKNV